MVDVERLAATLSEMAHVALGDHPDPGDYSWGLPTVTEFAARIAAQYALLLPPPDKTCPTCSQWIEREAGDPRPNSPGDHDPAYHVAKAYGTTHQTVAH